MNKEKILQKFGNEEYQVNDNTFVMGVHHLLGKYIAKKFKGYNRVLDGCCGAGFMSMVLAKNVNQVIMVDINLEHLKQAEDNIKRVGFYNKVKFIQGDILDKRVLDRVSGIDGAFLDPDWARIGDSKNIHTPKLSDMLPPADILFNEINKKTENILLRLPKEVNLSELKSLPSHKLEKVYLDDDFKFYCVYFGELKKRVDNKELRIFAD
ncbi:MAG: methyltransferase domain-containing protein [bacterium]